MIKDIQIHIEEDIRKKHPDISDSELKEKLIILSDAIENQIREDFNKKYGNLEKREIDRKVREVNVKGYLTGKGGNLSKDRDQYLSEKAEFLVEDAICKIMYDQPGLLRRGLKTEKKTYQHLKSILGDITPNCSDENCSHGPQCYQMESDLILLYPSEEKINILLIEVKKSRAENFKNTGLVSEAFAQLVRDVRFILALIPDFHPEKVAIRTYAAFPEEPNIDGLFCNNCRQHVLSQEDFSLGFLPFSLGGEISDETDIFFLADFFREEIDKFINSDHFSFLSQFGFCVFPFKGTFSVKFFFYC